MSDNPKTTMPDEEYTLEEMYDVQPEGVLKFDLDLTASNESNEQKVVPIDRYLDFRATNENPEVTDEELRLHLNKFRRALFAMNMSLSNCTDLILPEPLRYEKHQDAVSRADNEAELAYRIQTQFINNTQGAFNDSQCEDLRELRDLLLDGETTVENAEIFLIALIDQVQENSNRILEKIKKD